MKTNSTLCLDPGFFILQISWKLIFKKITFNEKGYNFYVGNEKQMNELIRRNKTFHASLNYCQKNFVGHVLGCHNHDIDEIRFSEE